MIIPTFTRDEAIQNIINSELPSLVITGSYGQNTIELARNLRSDIVATCGHEDVHFVNAKWPFRPSSDARLNRAKSFTSRGRIVFGISQDHSFVHSWCSGGWFNGVIISDWSREQLDAFELINSQQRHEYNSEKDKAKKAEIARKHMDNVSVGMNDLLAEACKLTHEIEEQARSIGLLYLTDQEAASEAFSLIKKKYGDITKTIEERIFKNQ